MTKGALTMAGRLHLTLLGDMRIRDAGGADVTPRGRKMRALIAHLALVQAHAAGRERIVGLLWGDRGEAQARASLRQALADLRETAPAVAPLLLAGRQEIGLADALWESDAGQLEAAIGAGDAGAVAALLGGLTGPLLLDMDGLSPGYDDWLRGERARFEARIAAGALALAEAAGPDEREAARAIATALQRMADGTEDAVRLGMRLDHAAGDLASLHRRFRLLEGQLRRDFEAEPSPATRLLLTDLAAVAPVTGGDVAGASVAGGEPPIIVVSPFAVLDGDTGAEALARVLSNDIEAALSRLPDLRVLSLSRPNPERLERVSRGAIAGYALSGSVRPGAAGAQSGLRLVLRLVDIAEDRVVWSDQVDAAREDLGAALDHAVERVAGAMLPAVERDLVATRRLEAAEPAAYALYLRGRVGVLTARSLADAQGAARLLEQALELDPGFVNARLHLVLCYNTDFVQRVAGHDPTEWRARAMKLAQEAVQLEPHNADARARLGWCHLRHGQWGRAEALLREALALGPHHADNVEQCGLGLALLGETGEARALIQRAFRLNPFPRTDYFADTALTLALEGKFTAAVEQFEIAADPSLTYLAVQTACLGHAGQRVAAEACAERLRAGLAAIWSGPDPAVDADVPGMMQRFLPLRDDQHRAMLAEGLRAAGLQLAATRAVSLA